MTHIPDGLRVSGDDVILLACYRVDESKDGPVASVSINGTSMTLLERSNGASIWYARIDKARRFDVVVVRDSVSIDIGWAKP